MFLSEFYECNNGDIFAFVLDGWGTLINCVKVPDTTPLDVLQAAAKYGFPDADEYDPDDFCGKNLPELYEEFDTSNDVNLIAEMDGVSQAIVFPEKMGVAGHKLFQV